jgi:hypothetical protein
MDFPIISERKDVQAEYERMRLAGESHNTAEMLAFAKPPGVTGTDQAFLEGNCNGNQFEGQEAVGNAYAEDLVAAGGSPKGKVYMHGLAEYPGDPRAWVSGRDEAKKVVEERGWGCHGSVNVAMREKAQPTGGGVSDSLVDEHTAAVIAASPEPVKDVGEVRAAVKQAITPHWAKT